MTDDPKSHPHELISALLDGEATVPERAAVDRHLRDCVECRALLGDFRTLATAAAAGEPPPVPAGLLAAVRARLETAGGRAGPVAALPRPWWTNLWRSPLPAAAVAGVLFATVTLWILRESTAPVLQAPPAEGVESERQVGAEDESRATNAKDAIGTEQVVSGEAGTVATRPKEKRDAPSRKPAGSPVTSVPPPAAMMVREQPPPSPETGRGAGLLEENEPAGSAEASGEARSNTDLAPAPYRMEADALQRKAASPTTNAARELAAAGVRAGEGRELRFEFPGYSGSITEGGTIAIREGEFRCTARIGDSPAIRAEIASLFSLASSPDTGGTAVQEGKRIRTTSRITLSEPGVAPAQPGPSRELPPASAGEIGRRIDGLIQGPLRETLKDQCGRLPGAGSHAPAD